MSEAAIPGQALPSTITIDGPAGAGKSTIGALLAERLGYRFFDTGVLYRAVALAALRRGVAATDAPRLAEIAANLDLTFEPEHGDDGRRETLRLDGEDVTRALRQPEVNAIVSTVSAHPAVREALLDRQRAEGQAGRIVMVGRDIGTAVLPEANLKIYLDASETERARRRHSEEVERGEVSDEATVLEAVRRRDTLDSQRAVSPLRVPPGAFRLDTDHLSIEDVLRAILTAIGRGQETSGTARQSATRPGATTAGASLPE